MSSYLLGAVGRFAHWSKRSQTTVCSQHQYLCKIFCGKLWFNSFSYISQAWLIVIPFKCYQFTRSCWPLDDCILSQEKLICPIGTRETTRVNSHSVTFSHLTSTSATSQQAAVNAQRGISVQNLCHLDKNWQTRRQVVDFSALFFSSLQQNVLFCIGKFIWLLYWCYFRI